MKKNLLSSKISKHLKPVNVKNAKLDKLVMNWLTRQLEETIIKDFDFGHNIKTDFTCTGHNISSGNVVDYSKLRDFELGVVAQDTGVSLSDRELKFSTMYRFGSILKEPNPIICMNTVV